MGRRSRTRDVVAARPLVVAVIDENGTPVVDRFIYDDRSRPLNAEGKPFGEPLATPLATSAVRVREDAGNPHQSRRRV
jgi:hypothetical protein